MTVAESKKGLSWAALKWIAIVSMTLDHVMKTVLTQRELTDWGMSMEASYILIHLVLPLGRIAFPIFAYGIAQGCAFTRDRRKFLLRLLLFAAVSEIPFQLAFQLAFSGGLHLGPSLRFSLTNVLFTFLLGALGCLAWDFFREKGRAWIAVFPVLLLALLAEFLHTDYGGWGVFFVVLPYVLQSRRAKLISLAGLVIAFYGFYVPFNGITFSWLQGDWGSLLDLGCALLAVALLALYSGEKGGRYPKYFFYVYYPAHLLVLWALRMALGNL